MTKQENRENVRRWRQERKAEGYIHVAMMLPPKIAKQIKTTAKALMLYSKSDRIRS